MKRSDQFVVDVLLPTACFLFLSPVDWTSTGASCKLNSPREEPVIETRSLKAGGAAVDGPRVPKQHVARFHMTHHRLVFRQIRIIVGEAKVIDARMYPP